MFLILGSACFFGFGSFLLVQLCLVSTLCVFLLMFKLPDWGDLALVLSDSLLFKLLSIIFV